MKLALISEIHANLEALQATLDDIAPHSVDRIVCLATSSDTIRNLKNASRSFAKCRRFASQATTTAPFAGRLRPKLQQYRRARRRLDMQARDEWRSQLPCHSSA